MIEKKHHKGQKKNPIKKGIKKNHPIHCFCGQDKQNNQIIQHHHQNNQITKNDEFLKNHCIILGDGYGQQ